ncbi:MAG: Cys-tRNA(Pro) deacylase [Eggerthellaceae bacterium]|jgi:Cys-tRNA(Pro)/Cys-tRNA(Cys) deacylase|uniref:Cys-tRNA(Pro)/Cys-tRNA(Cys) deacylase n=1 Tax=Denitrobacterium detoxificans TaxID=79604 RepID=A0A1H8RZ78_9ACTN|nr:Cys-tRNA(Pro) deacylase [Denitrobacterium detoxificans]MCR5582844.1 Cys-tRNA(Pro) deacylase [Eggerthellaceae bacterium]SEO71504.1 Cys-tRNA(Pro)/Cys-tRNA(Cys) deacylase [Denitrobacterium detoxificans]
MGKKLHKTNAMRILDSEGVAYRTATYEVDENDLSGMHVAASLGQDPEQLFKTLVLVGERMGHVVCCIPTNCELDLKKVARAAGDKRVEMLPLKKLTPLTGYVRGGCSPLGMKKQFPTFIDETAVLFDEIYISAGERGEQIIVNGEDLARVVGATFADLCM